jgi:hypothetical protein
LGASVRQNKVKGMTSIVLAILTMPIMLGMWALPTKIESLTGIASLLLAAIVGFPALFWIWASYNSSGNQDDFLAGIIPAILIVPIGYPLIIGSLTQLVVIILRRMFSDERWDNSARLMGIALLYAIPGYWLYGS